MKIKQILDFLYSSISRINFLPSQGSELKANRQEVNKINRYDLCCTNLHFQRSFT